MQFVVYGRDADRFDDGENALHAVHQAYMDGWAAELVARGPTLSADGERHTGSIHVVDVDDLGAAHAFALGEPYTNAGWYADVSVEPLLPCVPGTMWDQPAPPPGQPSALVRASWTPVAPTDVDLDALRATYTRDGWLFGGLLTDDEGTTVTGAIAATDLAPADAEARFASIRTLVPSIGHTATVDRWTRGGRARP